MGSSCQLLHFLASPPDPSGTNTHLDFCKIFRGGSLSSFRISPACSVSTSLAAPACLATVCKRVQSLARGNLWDGGILVSPHLRLACGESRCQGEPANPPSHLTRTVSLMPSYVTMDLCETETKPVILRHLPIEARKYTL